MDDNNWLKHRMMADARKKAEQVNKDRYKEESKARLIKIARKKVQTSFIGAISQFEKKFGFLWGFKNVADNGRPIDFTPEQQLVKNTLSELGLDEEMFKIWWLEARENSFNNGMSQSRALEQEISQYTVDWGRYQNNMEVKE